MKNSSSPRNPASWITAFRSKYPNPWVATEQLLEFTSIRSLMLGTKSINTLTEEVSETYLPTRYHPIQLATLPSVVAVWKRTKPCSIHASPQRWPWHSTRPTHPHVREGCIYPQGSPPSNQRYQSLRSAIRHIKPLPGTTRSTMINTSQMFSLWTFFRK